MSRLSHSIRQHGLGRAQGFLHRRGLAVDRARHAFADTLRNVDVSQVIDGGANIGQFAKSLRHAGYAGPILSIEPGRSAHERLLTASSSDPRWSVLKAALGDQPGEMELHLSSDSVSSSLLPRNNELIETFTRSAQVSSETVEVTTLDILVSDHGFDPATTAVKLDLQGYESFALAGAEKTLGEFPVVQLEMGFVPTYDGQVLFDDLHRMVLDRGYELWSIVPAWVDRKTARLCWCDGIYLRQDLVNRVS